MKIPITFLIYQASRAIHLHLNKALSENGLPLLIEQWPVLMEIVHNNGISQQELANRVGKNKTTLTRILNTLEKNGFIRRETSTVDKRSKLLYHNDEAEEISPKIIEVLKEQSLEILKGLESDAEEGMREGLDVVFRNLNCEFNFLNIKYSYKQNQKP